jgi:hypothetical protein
MLAAEVREHIERLFKTLFSAICVFSTARMKLRRGKGE